MDLNTIYNEDCLQTMKRFPNESIDLILTDPPYGYLKHKLDKPVDFYAISDEWKRILKKDGFVAMFGRGTQLYKWASYLDDIGFKFKEEIVWDKGVDSSPLHIFNRVHELILLYTKSKGIIRKTRIQYEDMTNNIQFAQDLKILNKNLSTQKPTVLKQYLEDGIIRYTNKKFARAKYAIHWCEYNAKDVGVNTAINIIEGKKAKSIISMPPIHFNKSHPTEKPVELLARLIRITSDEGAIVYDGFAGSGSTAVACLKTGRKYICSEIDDEYYTTAVKRLENEKTLF